MDAQYFQSFALVSMAVMPIISRAETSSIGFFEQ